VIEGTAAQEGGWEIALLVAGDDDDGAKTGVGQAKEQIVELADPKLSAPTRKCSPLVGVNM